MLPMYLLLAAAALAATPAAYAQEPAEQQSEHPEAAPPPVRYAIPRAEAPRPVARPDPPQPVARPEPPRLEPATSAAADQGDAVPRGSRPRGDNPPVGTAVPRGTRPAPGPVERGVRVPDRGRTVIVSRPPVYNHYYYSPRRSYPYGYGAFGLGYFYYDPYAWYPRSSSIYGSYGSRSYGLSGRYHGRAFGFDVGELRLRVSPRHAQVFVDGYFAGVVDDYDGVLQGLRLESGPYHIEIVAPGYEPLAFDVRVSPGQTITYRGDLRPRP